MTAIGERHGQPPAGIATLTTNRRSALPEGQLLQWNWKLLAFGLKPIGNGIVFDRRCPRLLKLLLPVFLHARLAWSAHEAGSTPRLLALSMGHAAVEL